MGFLQAFIKFMMAILHSFTPMSDPPFDDPFRSYTIHSDEMKPSMTDFAIEAIHKIKQQYPKNNILVELVDNQSLRLSLESNDICPCDGVFDLDAEIRLTWHEENVFMCRTYTGNTMDSESIVGKGGNETGEGDLIIEISFDSDVTQGSIDETLLLLEFEPDPRITLC